jgi:hypothetical protein
LRMSETRVLVKPTEPAPMMATLKGEVMNSPRRRMSDG